MIDSNQFELKMIYKPYGRMPSAFESKRGKTVVEL